MRTSIMTAVTKLGNETVLISNEPVPVNKTLLADVNSTSATRNISVQHSANRIETVIKRPDISKHVLNGTNRQLIPIGIGKAMSIASKDINSLGKGGRRRKRALIKPTSYNFLVRHHPSSSRLLDFYSPSSKEVSNLKSDELSMFVKSVDPFLELEPFDDDFVDIAKPMTKPLFSSMHRDKLVPVSFMETFFSNEDFSSLSAQDFGDSGSQSKEKTQEYSEERDAYDIHGYEDAKDDERSVKPKPPAYNLALSKNHRFTPMRYWSGKPIILNRPGKMKIIEGLKTKQIHRFPGNTIPGSSTEASADKKPEEEEEHIHHHYYDQLKHVHHNPPKGFDPESFRLTIPSVVKQSHQYTNNKKHKHYHHIDNAPVIVKYSKKKKEKGSKKRPMTESEEEANYDEEGELSEKEIENAYKNYDDSQINQDINNDYQVDESGEETKIMEVKEKKEPKRAQTLVEKNLVDIDRIFFNAKNTTDKLEPKTFKNVWNLDYKMKIK